MKEISGNIVDIKERIIYQGVVVIDNNTIIDIREEPVDSSRFILPGFIDSHVHIESSMLIPQQFAKLVVPRGTIAVVSDPHEIANVLGENGVSFMIKDAELTPLEFFFGVPSCVPATPFETSGASMGPDVIERLIKKGCWFLSEMMNFPGVIDQNEEIIQKLKIAKKYNKPIDGHAPGLKGEELKRYVDGGITTDHECNTLEEALEKIELGMKIQIREGSAAKNYKALSSLIETHTDSVMFCTDDSHPDELINDGHIDKLVRRGIKDGYDVFDILKVACVNPVRHYQLPIGLLQKGDRADFICVDNLSEFNIQESYINGECVFNEGEIKFASTKQQPKNSFSADFIESNSIKVFAPDMVNSTVQVMQCFDGNLYTKSFDWKPILSEDSEIRSDKDNDILKLVVLNRYNPNAKPSIGFIQNIGLKQGAFGGTIAHDSHNIIAVGVDDESIVKVINKLIDMKGGIVAYKGIGNNMHTLSLPFGGLMSDEDGHAVAKKYEALNGVVKDLGSDLSAPFMTLAFMSLLVIPELKLGDKGLFDVTKFSFTPLVKNY